MSQKQSLQPVGVVGLGLMGTAFTERLLEAGYAVKVYNRTRSKAEPLLALGAKWSDNPLVECERVIFSVFTTQDVVEVLEGMKSALRPGQILLDTSTSQPGQAASLGQRLQADGVDLLEAPFSGSSQQTRQGKATAIVAGKRSVFEACDDLLPCLAAQTFYVGSWGNAAKTKLVSNLVLGLNRAAFAEGLVFADAIGLDTAQVFEVLINSIAYSRTMDTKGKKMMTGDFAPQAKLSQHLKDVRLILDEAQREGQRLPMSERHCELLEQAEEAGLGQLDNSAVLQAIQSWTT